MLHLYKIVFEDTHGKSASDNDGLAELNFKKLDLLLMRSNILD